MVVRGVGHPQPHLALWRPLIWLDLLLQLQLCFSCSVESWKGPLSVRVVESGQRSGPWVSFLSKRRRERLTALSAVVVLTHVFVLEPLFEMFKVDQLFFFSFLALLMSSMQTF